MRVAVVLFVAVVIVTTVEGTPPTPPPLPRCFTCLVRRNVRDAKQDSAFNAAAEDGYLSDDEIKSVLGVADGDLAEFKSLYDVNRNGEISIAEYEAVSVIMEKAKEEEEKET